MRRHRARAACRVAIDPQYRHRRKRLYHGLLAALRAHADRPQFRQPAIGTFARKRARISAMMTSEARRLSVQREPRFAARASCGPAATRAEIGRRVAAAIDEEQHLIAMREVRGDRTSQWCAESIVELEPAHVDEPNRCRLGGARARDQSNVSIAST